MSDHVKPGQRVIIIGGPRRGKSTLARQLASELAVAGNQNLFAPVRCGDPLSKVKDPLPGVQYLPEGIPISGDDGAAQWVADNWFSQKGPWICEGWVMARALRRWLASTNMEQVTQRRRGGYDVRLQAPKPADRIIVLSGPAWVDASKGQEAMHRAVMTVWSQIAGYFRDITEERYR
jgi:hypothetical protein